MAKRILFITTDMMRWNSLGFTGCEYVNTPVLDSLAKEGIYYQNAYNQNPLCMPSRNVMLTGQYPRTNGSWNNGIALSHDSPTVAETLSGAGHHNGFFSDVPHYFVPGMNFTRGFHQWEFVRGQAEARAALPRRRSPGSARRIVL